MLNILCEIDREEIQVYRGSAFPLCGKLEVAPEIHGESGLEGAQLKQSQKKALEEDAFM